MRVPFSTQVGHTGPLPPSDVGRPIPYIDQIALDFPEFTIVCGHIGYPSLYGARSSGVWLLTERCADRRVARRAGSQLGG